MRDHRFRSVLLRCSMFACVRFHLLSDFSLRKQSVNFWLIIVSFAQASEPNRNMRTKVIQTG